MGTAMFPSPAIMTQAISASKSQLVTVSLRRETAGKNAGQDFFDLIEKSNTYILPNTAGCFSVKEAVTTAHMAREIFETPRIKLEVIANPDTLQPDVFGLVEAAEILCSEGFQVFPYTTEDLGVAEKLLKAGCKVLMPWGAPIGSAQGLANPRALQTLRNWFADVPLIIDAGIGTPAHAIQAMEMGYDAILLNTAIAKANKPVLMAEAFAGAIESGHKACQAGLLEPRDMASPSTPVAGTPFFDFDTAG